MKNERGITLVALVVTIIVLLILAGIAISLTVGNNGLFTRTQNAADTWDEASKKEQNEISNFSDIYDNKVKELGLGNKEEIKKFEFIINDYHNDYILYAYEGDTWLTWLEDVEKGLHPEIEGLDMNVLNAFLGNAEIRDEVMCYLPGMTSGAYIYHEEAGVTYDAKYSDLIRNDIIYYLYAE